MDSHFYQLRNSLKSFTQILRYNSLIEKPFVYILRHYNATHRFILVNRSSIVLKLAFLIFLGMWYILSECEDKVIWCKLEPVWNRIFSPFLPHLLHKSCVKCKSSKQNTCMEHFIILYETIYLKRFNHKKLQLNSYIYE